MQHILVTGASGNLGTAVIEKFLAEGQLVTGLARAHEKLNFAKNPGYLGIDADLSGENAAADAIKKVMAQRDRIDVAVLTVGGFDMGGMEDTGHEALQKQIDTNFFTAYHIARPVFLQMKKQGSGRLFLFGSKAGLDTRNSKGMLAYGLSKAMIFRLGEYLNLEAGSSDIVTSVVVPSTIDTPQNRSAMPDADTSKWVTPAQIADVIFNYCGADMKAIRQPVIKVYNQA